MDSFNAGYATYHYKSHDKDLKIIDNTEMYIKFLDILKNGKCKILFSINDCAITNYLYKDYIKDTYNHKYQTSHVNIPNLKYGIIMHSYSNERKSNQRIGRLLRLNPDQQSVIHILAYKDTIDTEWTISALSDLDQSKITWKNIE
jgi:hypothetical protein